MKDLHHRLGGLRVNSYMTQAELGRRLGFTRQTIWHYENAKRKPNFATLIEYSKLFDVSIDYILKGGEKDGMA